MSSLQEPIRITLKSHYITTILIIQTQSSILLQSQCNYSTNVPEYIELGQQPGTSVDLLRCDCRIAPRAFLSTQCAAFCTLQQPLFKGRTAHRLKKLEEGNVNQNINPIQTHSSCNPYHPSAISLPPCNSHAIQAEEIA